MPESQVTDRTVSRLVTGRASKHLRYATIALAGTLVLVVGVLAYLEQQYGNVVDNFTANRNVHYVDVTFRAGDDSSQTGALRFADGADVERIASAAAAGRTQVVSQYRIPFGLTGSDGRTYFVEGLTAGGAGLLGVGAIPDGTAVGTTASPNLKLDVPVVEAHADGGMTSDRLAHASLTVEAMPAKPPIGVFGTVDPATLYVNEATFAHLIGTAYDGVDWSTFQKRHDGASNPYGFQAVAAEYVYVDNLDDVDRVGGALDHAGYSTTYTLRAFDDLAGTVSGSLSMGLWVIVGALLLCLVLTFANLQSYLNLAHRDMGILKHVGYPEARVRRIYRYRLRVMVTQAAIPGLVVAGAAAATRLGGRPGFVVLDLAVVVVLLAALYAAMATVQLPRHVRRPVLALLKLDRQFE
jgi:hypothetical protein